MIVFTASGPCLSTQLLFISFRFLAWNIQIISDLWQECVVWGFFIFFIHVSSNTSPDVHLGLPQYSIGCFYSAPSGGATVFDRSIRTSRLSKIYMHLSTFLGSEVRGIS